MAFRQRVTGPSADTLSARFLVVQLQHSILAVWADTVRGVLKPEEMEGRHEVVLLGDTYRPTNLARRLSLPSAATHSDSRFVLCHRGQGRCVVAVDQVLGLTDVRRDDIQPLPALFVGEERVWFRGLFLFQERMAVVLNPDWLVHDLESSTPVLQPASSGGVAR